MKVLHISSKDIAGGAAIAAYRLHTALNKEGIDSKMLVKNKITDDPNITVMRHQRNHIFAKIYRKINHLIVRRMLPKKYNFSDGRLGFNIVNHPWVHDADVLHLHYINVNAIKLKSLKHLSKLNKPIIWTMHDMWSFTGGCHYAGNCQKYKQTCEKCPVLASHKNRDLSHKIFSEKDYTYKQISFHSVACSQWLGQCAKDSHLLKHQQVSVIQNTLNTNLFKPVNTENSRERLNISEDKFTIMFGAMKATSDPRKGYKYLMEALTLFLNHKAVDPAKIQVIIVGASAESNNQEPRHSITTDIQYLGTFTDELSMALSYDAADLFVAPSLEDNLPNMVLESLSCGTPVVAFNIGGMPDLIKHTHHGFIADEITSKALAEGMLYYYQDQARLKQHSVHAREHVLKHNHESIIAKQYIAVYNE